MLTRLIAAFTFRDYRILWVMLIIGSIAFWMRILGTAQWLLEETGSAYMVGLIGVVQLIVQLPMTLWAGTLADRVDRKRLMSLAHGATGVSLVTLGVLSSTNALTPALVYVGIAITAGTHMLASPARGALLAAVVPEGKLMLASSTDTASANAAAIAGPLLFAGIVLTADLTTVFLTAGFLPWSMRSCPCCYALMVMLRASRARRAISHPKSSKLALDCGTLARTRFCRAFFS